MGKSPLFSVIIACYNNEEFIEGLTSSINSQSFRDFEIIVVDGGSTDKTIDLFKSLIKQDVPVLIISEKDKGIGDAWNKGLKVSKGDFICLLNSDDLWPASYLNEINLHLKHEKRKNMIFYGKTKMISRNTLDVIKKVDKKTIFPLLFLGFRFMHTSCVIHRDVYAKVGYFDIGVQIAVDTDWLLRAVSIKIPFKKLPHENLMRVGGVSDLHEYKAYNEYLDRGIAHGVFRMPKKLYKLIRFFQINVRKNILCL